MDTGSEPPERIGVLFMQSQEFFGADSQIHASIMRYLPRDRFEVHCAAPKVRGGRPSAARRAVDELPGVRVRATEFGPSLDQSDRRRLAVDAAVHGAPAVASIIGLARYVRKHRIQVIHCTEKPRDAFYGTILAALTRTHCVIHVHVKAEGWIRSIVRRSMRRAAALIGVSEFVAQSLRDLGYADSRVFAVLNGLEIDEWIDAAGGPAIRQEFGLTPDQPLVVSASRLFRYKGQHELLLALPQVRREVPDVKVLVVGADDPRGFSGESSYLAELQRMRTELDLGDSVVFTGWRSDVKAIMAASDVYCMPSFEEPFGMVFTEAMALGKPVVALDNGGTKEVVDHGGSGLLSSPGDTDALASHLVALLTDPQRRKVMGEHGRRRVIERFSAQRMAAEVASVYERVLGWPPSTDLGRQPDGHAATAR
jgi:glycosyltransferase involved in cell wall biosynthesis